MSDNSNSKKKGFGVYFIFSTLNSIVSQVKEFIKIHITKCGKLSDDLLTCDKYITIFRAPFCPRNGNFAPLLSTYLQKYKNNNTAIRFLLLKCSILVLVGSGLSVALVVAAKFFIASIKTQYILYLLGISPLIYAFFFNAFCSVLLNVHERYTSSSSSLLVANFFSVSVVLILFLWSMITHRPVDSTVMFFVFAISHLLYGVAQSILLFSKAKDLLCEPTDNYVLSGEDYALAGNLQKDLVVTFLYQAPKSLADCLIYSIISSIQGGLISLINTAHKAICCIIVCIVQPLYHMSYKVLHNNTEEEFRDNSGELIFILHMFITPLLLLVSNTQLCTVLVPRVFSLEQSGFPDCTRIFQVVAYSTYFGSMARILKNIISLSKKPHTLVFSSATAMSIQGIFVVMYLLAKSYSINTAYVDYSVLAQIVKYSISMGDMIEFVYLMGNILKNNLTSFSYNKIAAISISFAACLVVLFTDISIASTLIISLIFAITAVVNCLKYLNRH